MLKHLFRVCLLILGVATFTFAAEAETESADAPLVPPTLPGGGYRVQLTDDYAAPFVAKTPSTEVDKLRPAAAAWFMTGQIHAQRDTPEELEKATNCFQKVVDLQPQALPAYRQLLPLLLARGKIEESRVLAFKIAATDQRGVDLVRALAGVVIRTSPTEAVRILDEALKLPTIPADSLNHLLVQRDLGLFQRINKNDAAAATCFRQVFDKLQVANSGLSDADRKLLLGEEPGATFDEFGQAFLAAKLPDLALAAFSEASKYREARPGLHSYNLALVFRETGKTEESLAELQKYFDAQLQNKGRSAYQLLKDLLKDLNKSEELVSRLEAIFTKDDKNTSLRFYLADEYLAQNKTEQAEKLYSPDGEDPRDPRALVGLIAVYRAPPQGEKLLGLLGKALALQLPYEVSAEDAAKMDDETRAVVERHAAEMQNLLKDPGALDALAVAGKSLENADETKNETFVEAWALGKLMVEAKRTDDANKYYRLAITMRNDPPGQLYRELGQHLLDVDRYPDAITLLKEALEHESEGLEAERWIFLYFISYAYEFNGQTAEALAAVAEARGLQPENSALHLQEGFVHSHASHWDDAIAVYLDIIASYPTDPETLKKARFALSNCHVQKGDREAGEKILEEVLQTDPEDSQANNDLGYLWAEQGKNLDQAKKMIERALIKEPENAAYLDSFGWVLFKLGKVDDAIAQLEKSSKLERGQDATIFDHLGDCYKAANRPDDAKAAWTKGLELEKKKVKPDDKMLQKLTEKLTPTS